EMLSIVAEEHGARFGVVAPEYNADNGAMIAWAGLERLRLGLVDDMSALARPRWPLDELKPRGDAAAATGATG
ncbi:MAG: hypothetical protein Q8S58_12800, partial [Bosea sp. (in: a-proteobacteria)]|nr:hypothetical protein [Bosea sp. (in: a-proteobacteria)]